MAIFRLNQDRALAVWSASKIKMSAEYFDKQNLLQNADQLFDENKYQEAVNLLKKHPVKSLVDCVNCVWIFISYGRDTKLFNFFCSKLFTLSETETN